MAKPHHSKSKSPPAHVSSQAAKAAKPKETHWAPVAEWYDQLVGDQGSEYHQQVILPGIGRMLRSPGEKESKSSLKILDLACGQGVLARKLAAQGHAVTAVDAAAPLIDAAKRRNEADALPIVYVTADATRLLGEDGVLVPPLARDAFDAVTIVLAIQNMTPLSPVWHAAHAALKVGGHLILVMMHPCFRVPQKSDWAWDEKGAGGGAGSGRQGRVMYEYLSSSRIEIQTHPGQAAHGKGSASTTHFHRPLQAYVNTLANAGLLIDHIEEWASHKTSEAGPRKKALDFARLQFPMFLAVRARKVIG